MRRVDSLEKTLMLGGIGGRRRRGWQRMRWLDGITDSMNVNLNGMNGSWWWTGMPGVLRFMGSQRVGHDWATELNWTELPLMRPWYLPVISLSSALQSCPVFPSYTLNKNINPNCPENCPSFGSNCRMFLVTWCARLHPGLWERELEWHDRESGGRWRAGCDESAWGSVWNFCKFAVILSSCLGPVLRPFSLILRFGG